MSQAGHVLEFVKKFSETGLQRTLSTVSDLIQGKGNRDDILFLDANLFGTLGLVATIMPGLLTAFAGGGFSSGSYAASCTRTMGIFMVTMSYLIHATSHTPANGHMNKALLLFWILSTLNLFHVIAYTELSSITHYMAFFLCLVMTMAHAIIGKIITF